MMDYLFFGIVMFTAGWLVGWWLRGRDMPKNDRTPFHFETAPGQAVRLHFIGALDERTAKRLAHHVADGKDFSGPALERRWKRGGFLSPAEFVGVRVELLKLGLAYTYGRGRVALHPSGRHFFIRLEHR